MIRQKTGGENDHNLRHAKLPGLRFRKEAD